jgi:hypothetical protein
MSPAYTSSTRGGKDHLSSSRLQDRGLIDYNTLRAKMSQILGTYSTFASFTHKKTSSDSCSSSAKVAFFRFNLEVMCHRIWNVNFLSKYRGYSHINVLYKSTSCHEHDSRCDDDRVFPSWLDPLDRTQCNLFNGLIWGAISTTPRVAALGVISTTRHEHESRCDDDHVFPNRLDPPDQILTCWMGSHEELYQLLPGSFHPG